jgi:hypothetical protein
MVERAPDLRALASDMECAGSRTDPTREYELSGRMVVGRYLSDWRRRELRRHQLHRAHEECRHDAEFEPQQLGDSRLWHAISE